MILETIRAVTDALNNVGYGVNAKLALVPLDAGDTVPDNVSLIVDETRDDVAARNQLSDTLPCITVTLNGAVTLDGEVMSSYRNGEIPILIRYANRLSETSVGNSNAYYVMRAIEMCLKDFHSNTHVADRTRNNVFVGECAEISIGGVYHPKEDSVIVGDVAVRYTVRDITP